MTMLLASTYRGWNLYKVSSPRQIVGDIGGHLLRLKTPGTADIRVSHRLPDQRSLRTSGESTLVVGTLIR